MKNLILGTANFGNTYGIQNENSLLSEKKIQGIIERAYSYGISKYDTAPGYGNSECILGKNINYTNAEVYTKIPISTFGSWQSIEDSIQQSLKKLHIKKLRGIYFHGIPNSSADLKRFKKIFQGQELKRYSELQGFSIYTQTEIEKVMSEIENINLIQLPYNLLSKSKFSLKFLQDLKTSQIELNVRSIFLQGLLLNEKFKIKNTQFDEKTLNLYFQKLETFGIKPISICMSFINQLSLFDGIILGINSKKQLKELYCESLNTSKLDIDFDSFQDLNDWTSDPRNWKT